MKPSATTEQNPLPIGGKVSRQTKGAPQSETGTAAVPSSAADVAALEARIAEIRWLTQHYGVRVRALLNDNEALRQRIKTLTAVSEAAQVKAAPTGDMRQMQALRAELAHMMAANERYLARIYELKAQLASAEEV